MQRIICSAIFIPNEDKHVHQPKNIKTGFVIAGRRHHNCFATAKIMGYDRLVNSREIQGFITSDDLFVDRQEAYKIALAANQIEDKNPCNNCPSKIEECLDRPCSVKLFYNKKELYSEDIY
jgi:hypothetical protein